jgi:hypothetical protein
VASTPSPTFLDQLLFLFSGMKRFSALCGAAAVVGLLAPGHLRERIALGGTLSSAFWLVFLFFYAGSYNYGAGRALLR